MASRSKRALIAKETVEILNQGRYALADGSQVRLRDDLAAAREGTTLYCPDSWDAVFERVNGQRGEFDTQFQVRNCTTFAAAKQLVEAGDSPDPLCLNFASAKNPGGGFLNGSQAQEECLARASGLYACIYPVMGYYEANRHCGTSLYTQHMIYSPRVPVFRDDEDQLLDRPYVTSIITAPAVNAGAVRKNEPDQVHRIEKVMRQRIEGVLALAVLHQHEALVLGAWGCGVFRNNPADVARWFHEFLKEDDRFRKAFKTVVFAVLARSSEAATLAAFEERFG